jgi:DNA-binding HxlR family transcriptional regulator
MWERLRELTDVGLIVRQVDPGPPIKSTYMATSRAADVQLRIDELRTALGHTVPRDEPT